MPLATWVRAFLEAALDVLAPPCCAACAAVARLSSGYCTACGTPEALLDVTCHIERVPVFAGARYAEPLPSAIHRFKYGASPELSALLAKPAQRGIDLLGIEPGDVWVPVPLHPLRLAERGYNQAALLAADLARTAGGRVDALRLTRLRHTEQQAKRQRTARLENVSAAFAASSRRSRSPERIVLVDDVVTSGATLAACIRALRGAGDQVVGCVAVADATGLSAASGDAISF